MCLAAGSLFIASITLSRRQTAQLTTATYFDRDASHTLRRIEALRTVCDKDFGGIKMILDLTAALKRLRRDVRLLSRAKGSGSAKKSPKGRSSTRRRYS
jgi:hypothetical protein